MSSPHFFYLYNNNWDHEIAAYEAGQVPSHRLFGYADLKKLGYKTSACPMPKVCSRLVSRPLLWRIYQSIFAVTRQKKFDCFVAVHEAAALPLLLLKRLGLIRKPLVVMNVSLLHERNLSGKRRVLLTWLLPVAEAIICYASSQIDGVRAEFGVKADRLFFIPFGIDTDYFQGTSHAELGDFCLSVGTNDGKDFATLVQALPERIKLVIVTDGYNANLIKENYSPGPQIEVRQAIPIQELKRLYEAARMHIIPIREMRFSSGQTTLLENMALGKAVIISDTAAVRDYVENGVTAICVRPGDVAQLREEIEKAWDNPIQNVYIGQQAAQVVRERFSSETFARKMVDLLQDVR